jgi:hypothetical protein
MTYRGTVCGNVVVFPPGVQLPDGLEVSVETLPALPSSAASNEAVSLRNGVPVYPVRDASLPRPNLDQVNALRDETL